MDLQGEEEATAQQIEPGIRQEVRAPLDAIPRPTYALMRWLLYGSGLRLMECVRLRVKDAAFSYQQLTVSDGKGMKDRVALLPVGSLAADVGFVHFYRAGQFRERTVLQSEADAMEHEPGNLLSDARGAANLARGNPVLGVDDQSHGGQPFVQSEGTIFKHPPRLDRELLGARPALPQTAGRQKPGVRRFTALTLYNAVRPVKRRHKAERVLRIDEESDRLDQSFGKRRFDYDEVKLTSILQ